MEFDDAESAAQWRNELAAAFFRYHNERDRYKASVPYDRIDKIDQLDWHAFSHVLTFTVNRAPIGQPAEHQRLDLGFLKRTSWVIARIKAGMLSVREEIKKWDSPLPRSQIPLLDIYSPHNPHQAPMQRMSSRSNSISQQPSELAPATSLDEQPTTGEYDDADLDERYAPTQRDQDRFHYVFGLAPDEHLVTVIPSYYVRSIPALGQLAIGPNGVMFLRKTKMMSDVKILVPVDQLKGASESSTIVAGVSSLHVHLKGHPDISFNFKNKKRRDWAIKCIEALAKEETAKPHGKSAVRKRASTVHSEPEALSALESWHLSSYAGQKRPTMAPELVNMFPRVIGGEGLAAKFNLEHLNVCCLTIGSRGDVQPYIALCQGLMKEGHKVCIASHPEYKEWVNSYGIEHQSVGGDPSILMEVSVGGKMFAPETLKRFREWFDRLLLESYEAVKGHDLLIESPSTFAGIHIAEALKIAYFRAFTMPFTKTADFPHAFMNGPVPLTRAYNLSTYLLFDQIMWRASSGQINKWRKETLHLPATDLDSLHIRDVPFIYNFSEAVVPRPMDWPSAFLGLRVVVSDSHQTRPSFRAIGSSSRTMTNTRRPIP
jgi:sterol 3beta-glucosyltransferase